MFIKVNRVLIKNVSLLIINKLVNTTFNCDTVAETGEECLNLIHPVIFVFIMLSPSCAHAPPDFQTCADNSISCRNLVFLHSVIATLGPILKF